MTGARVLLMRLRTRKSAKGTEYLSGLLGAARVVAFKAKEPDRYGNEQWEVYISEPEPKNDQAQITRHAERGQAAWDRARDVDRHADRSRAAAAGQVLLEHAPKRQDR